MSWDYRVVRYANGSGYGLHEVYYDEEGIPVNMTKDPVGFYGETNNELLKTLLMAVRNVIETPILEEPPEWSKKGETFD